jgi:hypothetical protein
VADQTCMLGVDMKHQYFGDVNDYRKYGLLRRLCRETSLRLGVCWMLTPNDNSADGNFVRYLSEPARWRSFDSELFDNLSHAAHSERSLNHVYERNFLPGATFFDATIPDHRLDRSAVMMRAREVLSDAELVFFDPDNGMEISSCAPGRRDSSKYLLWEEAQSTYHSGKSVLVYQHFPRKPRSEYIRDMTSKFRTLMHCDRVVCFRTARVVFFLTPQPAHDARLTEAAKHVSATWKGQIEVSTHGS